MMTKPKALLLGVGLLIIWTGTAQTQDLNAIGPKVGVTARDFSGVDQFGRTRTLHTLIERDGLMLVFFRSADW